MKLCFGPYGVLFVGNGDNAGNVSIYRIAPGGGPGSVSPYGQAVWDPDPVAYDASGAISGTPGAVSDRWWRFLAPAHDGDSPGRHR